MKKQIILIFSFVALAATHTAQPICTSFLLNMLKNSTIRKSIGSMSAAFVVPQLKKNEQTPIAAKAPRQHTFIFSHGLGGNRNEVKIYQEQGILQPSPAAAFNFPDATPRGNFNPEESCLGQENDIATLKAVYQHAQKHSHDLTLFGVSRGAATTVNFLGNEECSAVKAAVLESPFDHVQSIVAEKVGVFSSIAHYIVPFIYKKYTTAGPQPIKSASKIPKNIPLMLVCSKEDKVIPCSSTQALYKELKNNGHEHAHMLTLNTGDHAQIIWGSDSETYRNTVHAFYKKYSLPHDAQWAEKGEDSLQKCLPAVESFAQQPSYFASLTSKK